MLNSIKLCVGICAIVAACQAIPAPSIVTNSRSSGSPSTKQIDDVHPLPVIVPFSKYDRVKHFLNDRSMISDDGEIMFCPNNADIEEYGCDINGKLAWTPIQQSAPDGYQIAFYEYRFVSGSKLLIVYYSKKEGQ